MGTPIDRTNRFLVGEPVAFEEAFPTLQDVTVECYEVGKGDNVQYVMGRDAPASYTYGPPRSFRSSGGLLRCSNPLCNRGGYEIDLDFHDMVQRKLIQKEFIRGCPGDEGSPKGRRPGRRCLNALHYRITLHYKPEHQPVRWKLRGELTEVTMLGCPICRCPLVQEQERPTGLLFCGLHEFKSLEEDYLILESRKDYGQWPRQGERVHGQRLRVQCLEVDEGIAKALITGGGGDEIRGRAAACAREDVPILSRAGLGFNAVIFAGGEFRLLPLTGDRARRLI